MLRVAPNVTNGIIFAAAAAAAGLAHAERATAQDWNDLRGELFGYVDLAVPVGDFRNHVDFGGGAGGGGVLLLDDDGMVGLRAEGNYIVYGVSTERARLSPTVPFVEVDMQTSNSILTAGVGPQAYLATGPVRPYVYATVGLSYFSTSSSIKGIYDDEDFATTINYDDIQLALAGGGGLSVRIREGANPLSLDLSASYLHNGLTRYLANGAENLRRVRRGKLVADPITSDANLITIRVGISALVG